jgi:protein SCO1/2
MDSYCNNTHQEVSGLCVLYIFYIAQFRRVSLLAMKGIKILLFVAACGIIAFFFQYIYQKNKEKPNHQLAIFGNEGHHVQKFAFTDQDGNPFTSENVKGSVAVVEYFFTTCKSICPIMNNQMMRVDSAFHQEPHFFILSHTVDPETDTVEAINAYAHAHRASKQWKFLTGSKKELYKMARESYLLDALENMDPNIDEDFIHTQNFALIDQQGRIRGVYDGLKSDEIDRLIEEIKLLLANEAN